MANRGSKIHILGPETAVTSNVALDTANTEVAFNLAVGVTKFLVKLRSASNDLKLTVGETASLSGTTYVTVPAGSSFSQDGFRAKAATKLFMQTATASQVAEIITWSN